jgi:hypothetical protein
MALDRAPAKREMDKKEGARHLLHAAVRMIIAGEDPFAIHLLVQSADKVITDYAARANKTLTADFAAHIRPEKRKEAYAVLRETYNYLKHADSDWDKLLGVQDLVRLNAITLFACVANFGAVFGETTDHMRLIIALNSMLFPDILKEETLPAEFKKALDSLANTTPADMFDIIQEFKALVLPNLSSERTADLADIGDFYDTPFAELQKRAPPS